MQRLIVTLCIFGLLLAQPLTTQAQTKDDLTGHVLEGEMRSVVERGIMAGYGNGVYKPNDSITRAQFATFLARALQLPGGYSDFSDVPGNYHLRDGISRAASVGIVGGYPGNVFKPNENISREQMAVMIDRALTYKGIEGHSIFLSFTDVEQIHPTFRVSVANNTYFGIIGGMPAGNGKFRFGPKENATRAHAAAFINRMLGVIETNGKRNVHFQLASMDGQGNITFDNQRYINYEDAVKNYVPTRHHLIYYGQEIMKMAKGIAVSRPPQDEAIVIIYSDEALRTQLTYVSSGVEMRYIDANEEKVTVEIAGKKGYVKQGHLMLVPTELLSGRSYYKNENGQLVHFVYNHITKRYGSYTYGKAPSFMSQTGTYYSWDGIEYFSLSGERVGEAHQYFNYLPLRTKSNYTAEELDSYINYVISSNPNITDSPLKDLGYAFKKAEDTYQINALYLFAKAIHESNFGTSQIAQEKKNLFGYQAYDRDPLNNAKPFESFEDSIIFVAESMNSRYLTPPADTYSGVSGTGTLCQYNGQTRSCGENYRGAVLGNKSHGMNVRYASDPFWGQKIAGHMYRADSFLGQKDMNSYEIGRTTSFLNVRHQPNTLRAAQFTFPHPNYYLVIVEESEQNDGSWYKVYSDHSDYEYAFVHGSYVERIQTVK
ncbi:S-layer homology domain-containing protein [Bacillus sp. FJAT-45350]|uniref:S-layer homology domain-containing protein n=1 Tax=Bacillus sp. FJAT-45350 TaxID=2011014 RepID=UPI0015C90126|nr:S-layer homology domain-containing protein [Bacillus sp. FJAT-45350]